jgi:hypothetical protein
MDEEFATLRAFQFDESRAYLWVFRRSTTERRFNAYHVPVDAELEDLLKELGAQFVEQVTEFSDYGHLAQNNENSALAIRQEQTTFDSLREQVELPEPEHLPDDRRKLTNALGYLVKFVHDNTCLYAVNRTTSSWKTKYSKGFVNVMFKDGEMSAIPDDSFSLRRDFDFVCIEGALFMRSKQAFESILKHKEDYQAALVALVQDDVFQDLFSEVQPILDYVGSNMIQLRRVATIIDKAVYSRPNFLDVVRDVNEARGWGLNFDEEGLIMPCPDTAKTIMQVLLDHRLLSEITDTIYDVPDAKVV